jgi:hypothetical protein
MNIHERISEQVDLAKTYAEDGAFRTAARVLRNLADEIEEHDRATGFPPPPAPRPPVANCGQVQESDEYVCPGCRMRWDVREDRPDCPNK